MQWSKPASTLIATLPETTTLLPKIAAPSKRKPMRENSILTGVYRTPVRKATNDQVRGIATQIVSSVAWCHLLVDSKWSDESDHWRKSEKRKIYSVIESMHSRLRVALLNKRLHILVLFWGLPTSELCQSVNSHPIASWVSSIPCYIVSHLSIAEFIWKSTKSADFVGRGKIMNMTTTTLRKLHVDRHNQLFSTFFISTSASARSYLLAT